MFDESFDVIVIGAGHAGCEAASAAARLGAETALVTLNLDLIGQMSCNPAVGGIAKGHVVREIDALGGIMGHVIDRTGIQFRLLNRSRGPAVQSPRAQADRALYRTEMRRVLEATPNLNLRQGVVIDLIIENNTVIGVEMQDTRRFAAKAVVIATGTFLNGTIHTGKQTFSAGRAGEPASIELAQALKNHGFPVGRLKTGTPPRLDGRTIDWTAFEPQPPDDKQKVGRVEGELGRRELRGHPQCCGVFVGKLEVRRNDAHDGVGQSVEVDRAADDPRIGAESRSP